MQLGQGSPCSTDTSGPLVSGTLRAPLSSRGILVPSRGPSCRGLGPDEAGVSGEAAAVDSEAVLQHLFTRVPCELFHSPMVAFEFVRFCADSLPLFGRNLDILKRSFPNLFKARSVVFGPGRGAGVGGGVWCLPLVLPPRRRPRMPAEGQGRPGGGPCVM